MGTGRVILLISSLLLTVLPGCLSRTKNQGERLYAANCAGCHGEQGQGLARLVPPLAGADYLAAHRDELPCLIRRGQNAPIVVNGVPYQQVMPAFPNLTPSQLTNLLNYVESHWGNAGTPRTIPEVQQQLRYCPRRE